MKLYVDNLPWKITDLGLRELFSKIGEVTSANVIADKARENIWGSGFYPKKFGFVNMPREDGQRAIEKLHGHYIERRTLRVIESTGLHFMWRWS